MKAKNKLVTFITLGVAVIWAVIAVVLFLQLDSHFSNKEIVKNGKTVEATVTGSEQDTSFSVNGEYYYYMTYYYFENGRRVDAKTSSSFKENQVSKVGEVIQVKVYNGKSIEATYESGPGVSVLAIFGGVAGAASLGFAIACACCIGKNVSIKRLSANGVKTTAIFKASHIDSYSNNVARCKVEYTFKDDTGFDRCEYSIGFCTEDERDYLRSLGQFEIAYNNKSSVIVEDLVNRKDVEEARLNVVMGDSEHDEMYECEACLSIVKPNQNGTCPNCGNYIREYIIRNKK